jgi:hypothetical protein
LVYGSPRSTESNTENSDGQRLDGKQSSSAPEGITGVLPTMYEGSKEEEHSSIATNDVNYHELVLAGTSARDELEDKGRKGQKKTGG